MDKFDTMYPSSQFSNLLQVVRINPWTRLKTPRRRNCTHLLEEVNNSESNDNKKCNASMHNCNVATVVCSRMCQLLQVTIIRLYTRHIKSKLFYIYIYIYFLALYILLTYVRSRSCLLTICKIISFYTSGIWPEEGYSE